MAGIVKTVIRLGVIGGLVTGAAVLIAGPERASAVFQQARGKLVHAIDQNIDDPVAMRAQLRSLESQYPRRISEVQGQLAEVHAHLRQLERDRTVADFIVSLAQSDYDELSALITRAEAARAENTGYAIAISFDQRSYDLDAAYRRAGDVSRTIDVYAARIADYDQELSSLRGDEEQLTRLLQKLETEHGEFQAQIANLERQIDAVARMGRMADLMAERQKRLDELSRYQVASLDQFKATLAKRQAELEARITTLSQREDRSTYEDVAKLQIDREHSDRSRQERKTIAPATHNRPVIEIRSGEKNAGESDAAKSSAGIASR